MDEELTLFYEDASTQLQLMENALLDVKDGSSDMEKIGEIFRAMHTIKGTAGMFDFSEIVGFTHIAENVLDKVRSEDLELDENLCSLFMGVKDVTENMVEYCVYEKTMPTELLDMTQNLSSELMAYTTEEISDSNIIIQETNEKNDEDIWHISLRFEQSFFNSGMDIISIFRFFNKKGEILVNIPILDNLPTIDELECLLTYIGFEFDFKSECSEDEIHEIFEFIEDDVSLYVFRHTQKEKLHELVEKHPTLKELFLEEGIFQNNDFNTNDTSQTNESENIIEPPIETENKKVELEEPIINKEEESSDNQKDKNNPSLEKEKTIEKNKNSFSLRVDSSKVDLLINKMGEMVIQNAKLMQMAELNEDDDLEEISNGMTMLLEEVREAVMNIRMVQVKDSFVKFRRIVNDTAKSLGKDIDFIIEGGETELDKSVVEKLSDPLVHMLRNAIDHGVETPEIRTSKGKKEKGTVILRAYPDSGSIIIEIEDDGAGINKDVVYNKALANGIISSDAHLSEQEIFKLIFEAGLSTAKEISNISGRGVGMDVVKRNIEDLRGSINIESTLHLGSKIIIRLPLTLAIIDGFLVQAGKTKYIIPLDLISECIELNDEYKTYDGSSTINVRGDVLPLLDIRKFYKEELNEKLRENVVIVRYGNYKVGLQVDELYGEQQTVIKPLGAMFENIPGISGGSILGSGEVALIFDIPRLLEYKIKQGA